MKNELVTENLGLVHACANRFRNRGIDYEELYSAGCLGLVKAADRFDESLGFQFSTFAVPAVLGEIKRLFRDGGSVKVSRAMKEKARFVQMEKEKLSSETGTEPTVAEVAERVNLSVPETAELLLVFMPTLSLTGESETGEKQFDIPIEGEEEKIQEQLDLVRGLAALTEEEKRLIELRYFKGFTQTVAAEKLGMSQVQVSRKERVILEKLRKRLAS